MNEEQIGSEAEGAILDLLTAVIAVNSWPVEAALGLGESLCSERLVNLRFVVEMTDVEAAERLARAGYPKGRFMATLLARRWRGIAAALSPSAGRRLLELERNAGVGQDRELLALPGVGPEVLRQYKWLRHLRSVGEIP